MAKTHFIWNSVTDNVLMETDDTGAVQATYTQEPGLYGSVVSQKRGDETSYYHLDGQGSTRQLTDENQNVTDTATYTAFGEEVEKTGTTENPWGYKGALGYYAGESPDDDLYVRARHLSPSLGRWLSIDPLGLRGGTNVYEYSSSDPLGRSDPDGMDDVPVPLPLPLLQDLVRGANPSEVRDIRNCGTFYRAVIAENPSAVKCYNEFLKATETLPRLEKKACRAIGYYCKCCGKDSTHNAGIITGPAGAAYMYFCADAPGFRNRNTELVSQVYCHELTHLLQVYPCNAKGVKNWGELACLDVLKLEFIAYRCAGECNTKDGEIEYLKCAQRAGGSAKYHRKCSDKLLRKLFDNDLIDWVADNKEAIDKGTICQVAYLPPSK